MKLIGIVYNYDEGCAVELYRTPEQARKACELAIDTELYKSDDEDRRCCFEKLAAIDFTEDAGITLEEGGDSLEIRILEVLD